MQLGIHVVQVGRDRTVWEEQPFGDLPVAQAGGGHLGNLQLLPGQFVVDQRRATTGLLAAQTEFASGSSRECVAADVR